MKIVIFGLTISSSWGNGHATLWRGLCKALARLGHRVVFFEQDVPYYASARDYAEVPKGELLLYRSWADIENRARAELGNADAAIVTSYCPHALQVTEAIVDASQLLRVFYDLDTPVTLSRLRTGESVPYVGPQGLRAFDLVLSYTGGAAIDALKDSLGARRVRLLYGHVDPDVHRPVATMIHYRADLSYLGTYASDRQSQLQELFVAPARRKRRRKFLLAGAQYPDDLSWAPNIRFVEHLAPQEHCAFFSSSRLTLNVTRSAMAQMGWCPSGRLFEAAACGTPLLTDSWPGLEQFYTPDEQILTVQHTAEVLAALELEDTTLQRIGRAARERTLDEHTCHHRARTLLQWLEETADLASTPAVHGRTMDRSEVTAFQ